MNDTTLEKARRLALDQIASGIMMKKNGMAYKDWNEFSKDPNASYSQKQLIEISMNVLLEKLKGVST